MATLVSFHAHGRDRRPPGRWPRRRPSGTGWCSWSRRGGARRARARCAGRRRALSVRRTAETYESARLLGVDRAEFLGYVDSGMVGTPTSEVPWSFAQTPLDGLPPRGDPRRGAGRRHHDLRRQRRLRPPRPHPGAPGGSGPRTSSASSRSSNTINPDRADRGRRGDAGLAPEGIVGLFGPAGKPAEVITHRVDVSRLHGPQAVLDAGHRSQISETSFFLTMPDDMFGRAFGTEWYIADGPRRPGIARRRAVRTRPLMPATPGSSTHTGYTQQIASAQGRRATALLRRSGCAGSCSSRRRGG